MDTESPPFDLSFSPRGRWGAMWRPQRIRVAVAGTAEAPHPACLATLAAAVRGWPEVERRIAAFVSALPPDTHVPLQPASRGGFAASSCGFDETLAFESLSALDPDTPGRLEVTFYTGAPDGYATFAVTLVDEVPIEISAFAS